MLAQVILKIYFRVQKFAVRHSIDYSDFALSRNDCCLGDTITSPAALLKNLGPSKVNPKVSHFHRILLYELNSTVVILCNYTFLVSCTHPLKIVHSLV